MSFIKKHEIVYAILTSLLQLEKSNQCGADSHGNDYLGQKIVQANLPI